MIRKGELVCICGRQCVAAAAEHIGDENRINRRDIHHDNFFGMWVWPDINQLDLISAFAGHVAGFVKTAD